MAHSVSAVKRVRQNKKHRLLNKAVASEVRTAVKKFRATVQAGDLEKARELYLGTEKMLDQAAAKGVIHKNAAGRHKSRLALLLNRAAANK